jgi:hypothetical protein
MLIAVVQCSVCFKDNQHHTSINVHPMNSGIVQLVLLSPPPLLLLLLLAPADGTDKLTFQIPRITPGTSPPNHRHTAKLLVKATKGWPLVCILHANLNHLNDTVCKPVSGDHMIHPVHACPHLLTPKSRSAFHSGALLANPGNASQQLDLHASIDLSTGKLKLVDTLSDEYSFMNTTSGPLGTEPLPDDDGYDGSDIMLRYNDTAFYDQRLAALASTSAPADPVTFNAFVKMDAYLRWVLHKLSARSAPAMTWLRLGSTVKTYGSGVILKATVPCVLVCLQQAVCTPMLQGQLIPECCPYRVRMLQLPP